jgi:hypothetical protein
MKPANESRWLVFFMGELENKLPGMMPANDSRWLVFFMGELENKLPGMMPADLGLRSCSRASGRTAPADVSREELVALLWLFELLAIWEEKGRRDENRTENRSRVSQS